MDAQQNRRSVRRLFTVVFRGAMKAVLHEKYGPPEVLRLGEFPRPTPKGGEVLVRVHAATVNRTDCAILRAKPWIMRLITGLFRPKRRIPGTDFAGVVEAVGEHTHALKVGDAVFGFDDVLHFLLL